MDRMEASYLDKAAEKGSLVILACGFDFVPAEFGLMFNSRQWVGAAVPNRVEAYLSLESEKRSVGKWELRDWFGVANADKLMELQRSRPKKPRPEKLEVQWYPRQMLFPYSASQRGFTYSWSSSPKGPTIEHQKRIGLWAVKLPSADAIVVRRTLGALTENPGGLAGRNESDEHI
ncbi:hypothetical protein RchiOBHm_Chr4g0415091 [Rosa chinensis]|uniref:Uncharacterized protein n=1 Tax=Rosa chinensis TaxID=74649 RepID=A0A2P6QWI7_ROSCH|nr:hypothetical protein RchiOBHm_Chr4g0415091 [Rosa chinensis]